MGFRPRRNSPFVRAAAGLLAGGALVACRGAASKGQSLTVNVQNPAVAAGTLATIRHRLQLLGTGVTATAGPNGSVELHYRSPDERATAASVATTPGRLTFRPVVSVLSPPCRAGSAPGGDSLPGDLPEVPPGSSSVLFCYRLAPVVLDGSIVGSASAQPPPPSGGSWSLELMFTDTGGADWDRMATRYVKKQIAIVVDDIVKSAPVIQTTYFGGRAQISGNFTQTEAEQMAAVLGGGPLPSPVTVSG